MTGYIIQYSHEKQKWWGYGADAVTPPTDFTEGDALLKYDWLLRNWHKPYPATFIRLCHGDVVLRENELSPYPTVKEILEKE